MKRLFTYLPFCFTLLFTAVVSAQTFGSIDVAESIKQLKKLEFLAGEWKGKGWRMSQTGERLSVNVRETARYKLGGSVMIIEGLGTKDGKTVHDALAFVSYDRNKKKILIKAYLKNGNSLEMYPEVSENKLVWGFKTPQGGQTRFTVILNEKGNWFEIGEYSRDGGKTWIKTLEMELTRVGSKPDANSEARR